MAYNRITWAADVLRDAGLNVVEEPGWKTRGLSTSQRFEPEFIVWHHDASAIGDSPGVPDYMIANMATHGAQCWVCAGCDGEHVSGTWHMVASGRMAHAGAVLDGMPDNYDSVGIETDQTTGETWEPGLLPSLRRGTAALLRHMKKIQTALHFHKTICDPPGRKVDPYGLDLGDERANVKREITALSTPPEVPTVTWTTPIDKDPRPVAAAITIQTATANVRELPRHDDTIAKTFKLAATGCQLVGFQETGNPVYVRAMQAALVNHGCNGLAGDPQHNVSIAYDKALFRHVDSGYRKLFDGEDGISHTRHALWVELEMLADPTFHIIALSAHYPAGAFDPDGTPRDSGDRIQTRVDMWNEANVAMVKLLQELAAKGHPMVVFMDANRQKVRSLPTMIAGRTVRAISNALDWTFYIDGADVKWTIHEVNKVDILSDHKALQNRATATKG